MPLQLRTALYFLLATASAFIPVPPKLRSRLPVAFVSSIIRGSSITSSPVEYGVYLHNDESNMREYVARVLMMVAYVSEDQADSVMMAANWGYGGALVGIWEKELAEHTYEGMLKAGLRATLKRETGNDESNHDEKEKEGDDDDDDDDADDYNDGEGLERAKAVPWEIYRHWEK
mmetsp:Transcript_28505/g.58282  ORF Transcript_28505/g.58282 Transcript_28505/m.58282 type:complete len:174 (+) Transcript_28505:129-650(+)